MKFQPVSKSVIFYLRPISKYVVQQHSVSNSFMDDSIDSIMGPMSSTKIDSHHISPAHNR